MHVDQKVIEWKLKLKEWKKCAGGNFKRTTFRFIEHSALCVTSTKILKIWYQEKWNTTVLETQKKFMLKSVLLYIEAARKQFKNHKLNVSKIYFETNALKSMVINSKGN